MSESNGREPPEPLESGRYRVFPAANGFVIARATGTCERCQSCGCGDQQDNLDLSPAGVMKLLTQARKSGYIKGFPMLGSRS